MQREFFLGFIKVHILHHAALEPIYGSWLIEELAEHGYQLSPGTLYPILHSLEKEGLLSHREQVVAGKRRKYYTATALGREALAEARSRIRELVDEVLEEGDGSAPQPPKTKRKLS